MGRNDTPGIQLGNGKMSTPVNLRISTLHHTVESRSFPVNVHSKLCGLRGVMGSLVVKTSTVNQTNTRMRVKNLKIIFDGPRVEL